MRTQPLQHYEFYPRRRVASVARRPFSDILNPNEIASTSPHFGPTVLPAHATRAWAPTVDQSSAGAELARRLSLSVSHPPSSVEMDNNKRTVEDESAPAQGVTSADEPVPPPLVRRAHAAPTALPEAGHMRASAQMSARTGGGHVHVDHNARVSSRDESLSRAASAHTNVVCDQGQHAVQMTSETSGVPHGGTSSFPASIRTALSARLRAYRPLTKTRSAGASVEPRYKCIICHRVFLSTSSRQHHYTSVHSNGRPY